MSLLTAVEANRGRRIWTRLARVRWSFSTFQFMVLFAFTFAAFSFTATFLSFAFCFSFVLSFGKTPNLHCIWIFRTTLAEWLNLQLDSDSRLQICRQFGVHVVEVQESLAIQLEMRSIHPSTLSLNSSSLLFPGFRMWRMTTSLHRLRGQIFCWVSANLQIHCLWECSWWS